MLCQEDGRHIVDYRPMIEAICREKRQGEPVAKQAAKFMNTMICMAVELCKIIRTESGVEQVVLSGGTFQNLYMLKRLTEQLEEADFTVYRHRRVSTNDEGISFGQTAIAEKGN